MKQYYIAEPGKAPHGPYDETMVIRAFENNMYPKGTMVWYEGAATWEPIEKLILPKHSSMPPPPPHPAPSPAPAIDTAGWNVINALTSNFKSFGNFKGRACRAEFWYFTLASTLIYLILYILIMAVGAGSNSSDVGAAEVVIDLLYEIIFLIPQAAIFCRRLQDIGYDGKWGVVASIICSISSMLSNVDNEDASEAFLAIYVIIFLVIIVFACIPGKNINNPYGTAPLPPS